MRVPRPTIPAVALFALLAAARLAAQAPFPPASLADRTRLAEAMRVGDALRGRLWPGWEATAVPVLLVADSVEYLLRHPRPTADFTRLGPDPLLDTEVWARRRVFPPTFLATFPAVGGIPTVVVGSAERTGKSSAAWVLTLLHEHFHQWQYSQADYYPRLHALDLARGDTTGMWALQYPFPYDSAPVEEAVRQLAASLASALEAGAAGTAAEASVRTARDRLLALLAPDDRRYLEFQLWQEGVARWVEYAAAGEAARLAPPPAAFQALPDYSPYRTELARARSALGQELRGMNLGRDRRVVFYPLGAALALLAERQGDSWKEAYSERKFELSGIVGPTGR